MTFHNALYIKVKLLQWLSKVIGHRYISTYSLFVSKWRKIDMTNVSLYDHVPCLVDDNSLCSKICPDETSLLLQSQMGREKWGGAEKLVD